MMELYCASFEKNTANKNSSVRKAKQNTLMLVSKCAVCGKKKLRFIKSQEASTLLSRLEIRTPISKIPLISEILL